MDNDEWVKRIVAPAAKLTQDAAEFWPEQGVGPYAAVLNLRGGVCVAGGQTIEIACARMREQGVEPVAAVDYIMSQAYGNRPMLTTFSNIVQSCLKEGIALVGGESSAHDDQGENTVITYVWVIGITK